MEEFRICVGGGIEKTHTAHMVRAMGDPHIGTLRQIPKGSLIEVEGRLSTKLYPTMRVESVMTDILVDDCFGKIIKLHTTSKLRRFPVLPKEEEEIFA